MVGVVVVTLNDIGKQLLIAAEEMVGSVKHITPVSIAISDDAKTCRDKILAGLESVKDDKGVIVLIDLCGFTHFNVAQEMLVGKDAIIISGVNLPMLLKAAKVRRMNLMDVGGAIEEAARKYIVSTPTKNCKCNTNLVTPKVG